MIIFNKYFLIILFPLILIINAILLTTAKTANNTFSSNLIEEKVIQLERVQRAHSQLLFQFQKQLENNQQDINLLRDDVQQNQHNISEIIEQKN